MVFPQFILDIIGVLRTAGFEAWVVGGSVRDIVLGEKPQDWDLTTNARPDKMLELFPDAVYENDFGTVLVKVKDESGQTVEVVEVTTYRSESDYQDHRRPSQVNFEDHLAADLGRRDFTINAMALAPVAEQGGTLLAEGQSIVELAGEAVLLVDLFGGQKDLKKRIIRAVGEPEQRFKEDALRMMRGIRLAAQLGFALEPKTERSIVKLAGAIKFIAKERLRDELIKILSSRRPKYGIEKLQSDGLLNYLIPELLAGVGMEQNHHHIYTVFDHALNALEHCPSHEWPVRLAALLHDIGKPATRKITDGQATFYNHEYVGAKLTRKIMTRLRFANTDIDRVVNLVRHHMFYYNVGEVTAASVRRLIAKVGRDNLRDLISLRVADRLGSGTPKAMPYKLRHLQYMFDKVQHDPVSVKALAINGDDLIKELNMEPGPKFGCLLDCLLAEVLEDPRRNNRQHLLERAVILLQEDLATLRTKAKELIDEKREADDKKIKNHYKV